MLYWIVRTLNRLCTENLDLDKVYFEVTKYENIDNNVYKTAASMEHLQIDKKKLHTANWQLDKH